MMTRYPEPNRRWRRAVNGGLLCACSLLFAEGAAASFATNERPSSNRPDEELFFDDFEADLSAWELSDADSVRIRDSGDPERGHVLELVPKGAKLHALMRGSEAWRGYRVEGFFLFPTREHNYLGFLYNLVETDGRVDVGSLYVKGNGSYIRVNPRRDWNPARSLYEEWRVDLVDADRIGVGTWHYFAAEVVGNACHFYVGDDPEPKVTFDLYEHDEGRAGFKPRVVGGPVWLDDVVVTDIDRFSYDGERRPAGLVYRPEEMVQDWHVLGPLMRAHPQLEERRTPELDGGAGSEAALVENGVEHRWRPFETDGRGAVVTGRVVDFLGPRAVAYFSTTLDVAPGELLELHVSTIDDLAVWLDGRFEGYYGRDSYAWFDIGRNPRHPLEANPLILPPGRHHVLFRARGGVYASGGFFVRRVVRHE